MVLNQFCDNVESASGSIDTSTVALVVLQFAISVYFLIECELLEAGPLSFYSSWPALVLIVNSLSIKI